MAVIAAEDENRRQLPSVSRLESLRVPWSLNSRAISAGIWGELGDSLFFFFPSLLYPSPGERFPNILKCERKKRIRRSGIRGKNGSWSHGEGGGAEREKRAVEV